MSITDVFELLRADGPYGPDAEHLMLYGQFVGSWDMKATWFAADGSQTHATGEWHFAWVLGGRGIQDVLFASGSAAERYGTTLRCYDPADDVWHVSWMQPSSREFVHLTGRQVGDRIVQQALAQHGAERWRWSFTDVTSSSFVWLGEVSADSGVTWFLEQEMRASRRP
jgi:hypothetical protein